MRRGVSQIAVRRVEALLRFGEQGQREVIPRPVVSTLQIDFGSLFRLLHVDVEPAILADLPMAPGRHFDGGDGQLIPRYLSVVISLALDGRGELLALRRLEQL